MKTTLFKAIEASSFVVCNGYEVDGTVFDVPGHVRLDCGEDVLCLLPEQDLDVGSDGCARVALLQDNGVGCLGERFFDLEFRVTRPLTAVDL